MGRFVGCYAVYARQLGKIDGLPPLPEQYLPDPGNGDNPPDEVRPLPAVNKKLELAFYRECKELKYPIKIEVPSKRLVIASKDVEPENGLAKLTPVSIVMFGRYDEAFTRHRSEEHTSELQSLRHLVCRLLLEKKKN